MIYNIQSSSDFQAGAILIVKLPEADLDKKAFLTTNTSQPDLLLPFRHKSIDGQIELTYSIGKSSKLLYLKGSFSPKDYADILFSALNPLIECDDWFLTPYSFVLDSNYIYYDNDAKIVKFLYIPSSRQISDLGSLADMINVLAEHIRVTDVDLENKVLRALRKDFSLNTLLDILKPYRTQAAQGLQGAKESQKPQTPQTPYIQFAPPSTPPAAVSPPIQAVSPQAQPPTPAPPVVDIAPSIPVPSSLPTRPDDIEINFEDAPKGKQKKEKVKPVATPKVKSGGFFGGKSKPEKTGPASIIMGGDSDLRPPYIPVQTPAPAPVYENLNQPVSVYHDEYDEKTMIVDDSPPFTGLKLISREHSLPDKIIIELTPGDMFSIGRHAASVGTKQSDFEFGEKTKEISRRHAVIERTPSGYQLVDIGSKAGTYLNNGKLMPNVSQPLSKGDKVSFGKAGADYEWDCVE